MSDYQNSPACRLLATNCVCCGRPLVDACSVEMGIGPECRDGVFPEGCDEADRKVANEHVYRAALAAQAGKAQEVVELAGLIRQLGFPELADKVEGRFKAGVEAIVAGVGHKADIRIEEDGADLVVWTPYRRGEAQAFIAAWRAIPGRRFDVTRKANRVPAAAKPALWALLREFFPGKWGAGPKGAFRVPAKAKTA